MKGAEDIASAPDIQSIADRGGSDIDMGFDMFKDGCCLLSLLSVMFRSSLSSVHFIQCLSDDFKIGQLLLNVTHRPIAVISLLTSLLKPAFPSRRIPVFHGKVMLCKIVNRGVVRMELACMAFLKSFAAFGL